MALAKQKSRGAKDGRPDALPRTGSRRLSERSFGCDAAGREFSLSPAWIAFSKSRVIDIGHINWNFGSLPRAGNRIGKQAQGQGRASG
jgi:hypothetical protein